MDWESGKIALPSVRTMYIPATPDTVPAAPEDLTGEYDLDADVVRLRWDSPKEYGDSKINSYIVER